MRQSVRVTLGLALACLSCGCWGYWPLRWPRHELWRASVTPVPTIQLPSSDLATHPGYLLKDNVAVVLELIDAQHAKELFHVDLLTHGIQPLLLILYNRSDDSYIFSKASVDPHYLPATQVAQLAYMRPARMLARYLKWLTFVVPGFVFELVVEPASTLDFPVMETTAQRPPRQDRRGIQVEFVNSEIPDTIVTPDTSIAGILFVHPLPLGSHLPVMLLNAKTHQPLIFDMPLPSAVYTESHEYPHAYEAVWNAAMKSATSIGSWRLTSKDRAQGLIAVCKGRKIFIWAHVMKMTITLQKVDGEHTLVTLQSFLKRLDSRAYGEHDRTIERFFEGLASKLPRKIVPSKPLPISATPTKHKASVLKSTIDTAKPTSTY